MTSLGYLERTLQEGGLKDKLLALNLLENLYFNIKEKYEIVTKVDYGIYYSNKQVIDILQVIISSYINQKYYEVVDEIDQLMMKIGLPAVRFLFEKIQQNDEYYSYYIEAYSRIEKISLVYLEKIITNDSKINSKYIIDLCLLMNHSSEKIAKYIVKKYKRDRPDLFTTTICLLNMETKNVVKMVPFLLYELKRSKTKADLYFLYDAVIQIKALYKYQLDTDFEKSLMKKIVKDYLYIEENEVRYFAVKALYNFSISKENIISELRVAYSKEKDRKIKEILNKIIHSEKG